MAQSLEYILTEEDERLYVRELLQRRFNFSSRLITKIKYHGDITLNGKHVSVRAKGKAGDKLIAFYPEEKSYFEPENIPLNIAYEDDDILLVNKSAGLVVHPTYNYPEHTLANALSYYIKEKGQSWKIRFVNRLDMGTSGLIIVAKNAHSQDLISEQMKADTIVKKYYAIVHGYMEGEGTIDEPIDKDPNHIARRHVCQDGYPSVTHYKVLESFEKYSFIELKLDTGRTHQIRVHMTHIGHPLVGDELYAQLFGFWENPKDMPRPALHSHYLEFVHPTSGEKIAVDAKLPEDMAHCLDVIREKGELY